MHVNVSRHLSRAGAGLAGVAVAVRVLALAVPPGVRALDAVMVALAAGIGVVLIRRPSRWEARRVAIDTAASLALAVVTGVAVAAAGGGLPDFTLIAALAFGAILAGIDAGGPPALQLGAGGGVIVIFAATWLIGAPRGSPVASLVVAALALAGIRLLVLGSALRIRSGIDAETRRGLVYATLGRRVGVGRDVLSVASAILETCRETFPEASTGVILLNDPADGLLKSPGVHLSLTGVAPGGPGYELAPGEGLGGVVFESERAALWPTTLSASMAQASLREANRIRLRQSKLGFIRSAIGAPLRVEGACIGVILLTSERREHAWVDGDIALMEALAEEAARSLERARRHEDEMGHALLDAVTGLATRREVLSVIDKELARASRREGSLALIQLDIDGFGELNARWGHETGNRILGAFADVLRSILRREDSAARYGGDEFVCVLPGADRDQARAVAARIRQRFAAVTSGDPSLGAEGASASAGVAVYPGDAQDVDGLLATASAELDAARGARELTGRPHERSQVGDATPT